MWLASGSLSVPKGRIRARDGFLCLAMRCLWVVLVMTVLTAVPLAGQQGEQAGTMVIQDKAEFNAYMQASNLPDPTSRAEALDAFVQRYPHSVALVDALEEEMSAWEHAGDMDKVAETAKQIVAAEPGNIRALAIVVALNRTKAMAGNQVALHDLCIDTPRGAQNLGSWTKPAGMTNADFAHFRDQMKVIFVGAEGYCALQERKFAQARDFYTQVLKLDASNFENVYQLGVADLEMDPPDATGFWYCAKSIHLAEKAGNLLGIKTTTAYCMRKYATYHGSGEGWDAIVKAVAGQDAPPRHFASHIKRGHKHKSK